MQSLNTKPPAIEKASDELLNSLSQKTSRHVHSVKNHAYLTKHVETAGITRTLKTIHMKAKADPRHKKRAEVMKQLFAYSFDQTSAANTALISRVLPHMTEIDEVVKQCAPEWPLEQINKIDLAILRLSVYELMERNNPYKVVIDEAVELAKEYGSENSPKFVNGVLGSALKHLQIES